MSHGILTKKAQHGVDGDHDGYQQLRWKDDWRVVDRNISLNTGVIINDGVMDDVTYNDVSTMYAVLETACRDGDAHNGKDNKWVSWCLISSIKKLFFNIVYSFLKWPQNFQDDSKNTIKLLTYQSIYMID